MKYLRTTMPDGSKWDVSIQYLAERRALDYSDGAINDEYREELERGLHNINVLRDWAENNTNWGDVSARAILAEDPDITTDYDDGWVNGEKEIVERA